LSLQSEIFNEIPVEKQQISLFPISFVSGRAAWCVVMNFMTHFGHMN